MAKKRVKTSTGDLSGFHPYVREGMTTKLNGGKGLGRRDWMTSKIRFNEKTGEVSISIIPTRA